VLSFDVVPVLSVGVSVLALLPAVPSGAVISGNSLVVVVLVVACSAANAGAAASPRVMASKAALVLMPDIKNSSVVFTFNHAFATFSGLPMLSHIACSASCGEAKHKQQYWLWGVKRSFPVLRLMAYLQGVM
jgi:hypothetical protein